MAAKLFPKKVIDTSEQCASRCAPCPTLLFTRDFIGAYGVHLKFDLGAAFETSTRLRACSASLSDALKHVVIPGAGRRCLQIPPKAKKTASVRYFYLRALFWRGAARPGPARRCGSVRPGGFEAGCRARGEYGTIFTTRNMNSSERNEKIHEDLHYQLNIPFYSVKINSLTVYAHAQADCP